MTRRSGIPCVAFVAVLVLALWAGAGRAAAYGDDFETNNLLRLPWTTGGNVGWGTSSTQPHAGSFCAASGTITDSQTSSLECVVAMPAAGNVTFWYRTSCEQSFDFLRFYVDNVLQGQWSGLVGWTQTSFPVSAGQHTFRWTYIKDGVISSLGDKVFIDDVVFYESGDPVVAQFSFVVGTGVEYGRVTFADESSGSPTTWAWQFGDGGTSTAQDPSHTYAAPGTYVVTLTASGVEGTDVTTRAVEIVLPPAPEADFGVSPAAGFAPLVVELSNASTGAVTGWSWDFGDGGTSTAQDPTHEYASPGTYTVSLTATGPGGSDTETRTGCVSVADPTPTPSTMGFAVVPTAWSATAVGMIAVPAVSAGTLEYLFEETTGGPGATDGDWQTSAAFVDEGLAPGTVYSYRVKARGAVGFETLWSAERSVTTLPREGFESGGFLGDASVSWTTTATGPWVVQGDVVFDGAWAAASAAGLADGGVSTLSVVRDCEAGWVSFRCRVSSQEGADWLRFLVDGVEAGEWSGEVAWTEVAVAVDAGEHTFSWVYAKDGSGAAGDDRAYLDDVELPVAEAGAAETVYVNTGGGGGCVVGGEAGPAGVLLAVLLPVLALLGRARRVLASRRKAV